MVFKRFRIVVLARVFFLSASIYLLLHLIFNAETRLYATMLIITLIISYQIYGLIHYVEKTNRDLNRFLLTIKHEDLTQTFLGAGLGRSFDELKKAFNEVIQRFQRARAEKEEHFRYLQTVVQHVGIGLIAFGKDGKVVLFNTAAKKILRRPSLRNINDLKSASVELVNQLFKLRSGQKALIKVKDKDEILQLAISATEFRLQNESLTLVSLQNIQSELEEQELEAWQKLIRVLTHEIMNSVTPIASLASTLNDLVNPEENSDIDSVVDETRNDIQGGLKTIQRRSEGLLHFVNAYRNLTRIPVPDLRMVQMKDVLASVTQLMLAETRERKINLTTNVQPAGLQIMVDPELIEQILINIVKNAMEALNGSQDGQIAMVGRIDVRGRAQLQVIDNGPGISADVQDKIFIPFFTTKEEGSGIGLSLSRQIMRLHRGSISVSSKPGETVVTLRL